MPRWSACPIVAVAVVLSLGVSGRHASPERRRASDRWTASIQSAIADIEAGRRTTPLISQPTTGVATVTFLARRSGARPPRIVSDVTGWGEHLDGTFDFTVGAMTRVDGSDWYSLQVAVPVGARIEYLIAYGRTEYRLDPYNPRRSAGPDLGGAPASEAVMPDYVAPSEFADPPTSPGGATSDVTLDSRVLGKSCPLVVYTPHGYHKGGSYPLVVLLSMRVAQVKRVLDWAIAHDAIEPVVAVFVPPMVPGADSASAWTPPFLSDELTTWAVGRYGIAREAERHAIVGISYGAKDALDAALDPAASFDRLGLLIPGRRLSRADIDGLRARTAHHLEVAIVAGRYDQANLPTARGVHGALAAAGHGVRYTEVPEGHNPVTWTTHLRDVLVGLFGRSSAG